MTWNLLIQLVYLPSCIHINLYLRCRSVGMDDDGDAAYVYIGRLHHYQTTVVMNLQVNTIGRYLRNAFCG